MFPWRAGNLRSRCIERTFLPSPWARAMTRKMQRDSSAYLGCRRGRGRHYARSKARRWAAANEDVVRAVPAAAQSGVRKLATVFSVRQAIVERRGRRQLRLRRGFGEVGDIVSCGM